MKLQGQQAARALILICFSTFLFRLHYTGEITKFINPKYDDLSQGAAILFLLLFFIQITRVWTSTAEHGDSCIEVNHCCTHGHNHAHDHGNTPFTTKKLVSYMIIVFPLMTGFLLPAKVLDASIANKKGAMIALSGSGKTEAGKDAERSQNLDADEELPSEEPNTGEAEAGLATGLDNEMSSKEYDKLMMDLESSQEINLDDRVFSSFYEEISADAHPYKGRKIKLTGFVYKEAGWNDNQMVISRFLITHCVADASIIGFLSKIPEASKLKKDTWIKAEGILDVTTYNGASMPYIRVTNWEEIAEPKKPYLYPISIRHS